jgi:hypothetical protein
MNNYKRKEINTAYLFLVGERRGVYRVVGNLRERDRLEDPGIDGRIILRWIIRKWDGGHGVALAQDRDR